MDFNTNIDDELTCPHCMSDYLHQISVNVYEKKEDETDPLRICISEGEVIIVKDNEGNPSPRRDGLCIIFECEGCDNLSKLNIFQHKGCTYIQWSGE